MNIVAALTLRSGTDRTFSSAVVSHKGTKWSAGELHVIHSNTTKDTDYSLQRAIVPDCTEYRGVLTAMPCIRGFECLISCYDFQQSEIFFCV